jgi:hypothetical protein
VTHLRWALQFVASAAIGTLFGYLVVSVLILQVPPRWDIFPGVLAANMPMTLIGLGIWEWFSDRRRNRNKGE